MLFGLAVAGLVGNMATGTLRISSSAAPWVWVGAGVTVLLTMVAGAAQFDWPVGRRSPGAAAVRVPPTAAVTVLGGGRTGSWAGAAGVVFAALVIVSFPVAMAFTPGPGAGLPIHQAPPGAPSLFDTSPWAFSIGFGCVCAMILAYAVRVGRGSPRGVLEISDSGVVFHRGRYRLDVPWSEVSGATVRGGILTKYLVARPHATSALLTTAPTMSIYHSRSGFLRICDLTAAGIPVHAVRAALRRHLASSP
ncbi:hypothetical protein [Amycolatopsis sp. NPDC052450]|uniref:hypothetical protein n=1 Tax=Amycolatopsis sp. NPDC052450 TaxID=3363937 RepID=UPI0037CBD5A4